MCFTLRVVLLQYRTTRSLYSLKVQEIVWILNDILHYELLKVADTFELCEKETELYKVFYLGRITQLINRFPAIVYNIVNWIGGL